jgi:hypothetical protein
MRVQDCPSCLGTGRQRCSSCLGGAAMAKVTPGQQAWHGRHRRTRRYPSRSTHRVHLRPVSHEFVGVLCMAMGAFFLGFPAVGLFIPGLYNDFHAGDVWTLLLSYGLGLVCVWIGIRQFRNGAQVSGHKVTIRNELAGRPLHVPALGFTPLAQSLARHASQHTRPRLRGDSQVAGALRFAPIRSSGFSMSCAERAVNWLAACPAGPARPGLADRLPVDRRCADPGRRDRRRPDPVALGELAAP